MLIDEETKTRLIHILQLAEELVEAEYDAFPPGTAMSNIYAYSLIEIAELSNILQCAKNAHCNEDGVT